MVLLALLHSSPDFSSLQIVLCQDFPCGLCIRSPSPMECQNYSQTPETGYVPI